MSRDIRNQCSAPALNSISLPTIQFVTFLSTFNNSPDTLGANLVLVCDATHHASTSLVSISCVLLPFLSWPTTMVCKTPASKLTKHTSHIPATMIANDFPTTTSCINTIAQIRLNLPLDTLETALLQAAKKTPPWQQTQDPLQMLYRPPQRRLHW